VVSKKTDFTAAAIIDNFASEATTASVERVMKQLATEKASAIMATREPSLPSPTFITAYLTAFRPSPPPALPANPSTGDNTLSLAFSALEARDFPHALSLFHESLSQGISTSAGKAAALNMRATFKFIMSDAEGALKDLDEATETEKGNAQSWVKKASVHMELGRPEEAMKDFERALEIDPENADVFVTISSPSFASPPSPTPLTCRFYHRGQVYFITSSYDQAISEYRRSSELDPSFIFSHIQLAVAQYKAGSQDKALHQFRRLVEKHPESAEVYNYYGELLLDQQRFEEAVAAFDKSLELGKDRCVSSSSLSLSLSPLLPSYRTNYLPLTKQHPPQRPPDGEQSPRPLPTPSRLRPRRIDLPRSRHDRPSMRRWSRDSCSVVVAAE
jgi:import receptor subunit TOM70